MKNLKCMKLMFLWLVFFLYSFTGCYEGRNRPPPAPGDGPGGPPGKPRDSQPYYFILFEPILLAEESMRDPNCFRGPSSERIYRQNEWRARIKVIAASLNQLGVYFVMQPTYIEPEDCGQFSVLESRASQEIPQTPGWPSLPDSKRRLSIHLKAIFWD
jgi:hypothetical protein